MAFSPGSHTHIHSIVCSICVFYTWVEVCCVIMDGFVLCCVCVCVSVCCGAYPVQEVWGHSVWRAARHSLPFKCPDTDTLPLRTLPAEQDLPYRHRMAGGGGSTAQLISSFKQTFIFKLVCCGRIFEFQPFIFFRYEIIVVWSEHTHSNVSIKAWVSHFGMWQLNGIMQLDSTV